MSAIGDFRERIALQQEICVADTGGGAAVTWSDVASLWASVEPLRGKENVQGEGVTGVSGYRICFRSELEITTPMRIVWNSKTLNIRSARVIDARGRLVEVMAEEGVAI